MRNVEYTSTRIRVTREQKAVQVKRILSGNGKGFMKLTPTQKKALAKKGYRVPESLAS